MEKKLNPNPHKRVRQDTSNSWSELPRDLVNFVLERLGFADFQRAKSVCSSWHSASRQSVPKNQIPWLILFPEDNENNNSYSCRLFNPEEKDKLYRTQDLGLEFANSLCIATYGSWLLMRNSRCDLYIVNLFTNERINLPPVESQLGTTKLERINDVLFRITGHSRIEPEVSISIRSPVFWIDEKTKDYVVLWGLGSWCVVYSRKGDNSWNQIPETSDCCDMVYKEHKLYFFSYFGDVFKIFDFSGDIPQQSFRCVLTKDRFELGSPMIVSSFQLSSYDRREVHRKLVVTVTGDILMVERVLGRTFVVSGPRYETYSFRIHKVYPSRFSMKCEQVSSLGDEAMLLGLGITVLANDYEGININSIYCTERYEENLFNLETREMEQLHKFDCWSIQLSSARWFLPSFTQP